MTVLHNTNRRNDIAHLEEDETIPLELFEHRKLKLAYGITYYIDLIAVGVSSVTVSRTFLRTLKANATMLAWSFLHRCGVSAFSTIYAERKWGAFNHVAGWSDTAEANWSYTVRQRIYGCS